MHKVDSGDACDAQCRSARLRRRLYQLTPAHQVHAFLYARVERDKSGEFVDNFARLLLPTAGVVPRCLPVDATRSTPTSARGSASRRVETSLKTSKIHHFEALFVHITDTLAYAG